MGETLIYCFEDPKELAVIRQLVAAEWQASACPSFRLIAVPCEDWNRDLSPWPAPKVFDKGEDFAGGAAAYLRFLTETFIPKAEAGLTVEHRYLAGYSLAGLFSVYAAAQSDLFDGVASLSGSLWYDGFSDWLRDHPLSDRIRLAYFSVGSKEKNAREPRMQTVEEATRRAALLCRNRGIRSSFVLNPGGHFSKVPERIARGILWLLQNEDVLFVTC